ncbi:MAG: asparagine synthase-related protein, partial [Desulfobacteraceae bacterium]|nr:asparagine synthase-related protein [Desulfobacteraceae bacterium]
NDHRIAVSSYSPAAACVTDQIIDIEAVSGFFSFGFFPQNRTYIQGVKIIPPHTELVIDPVSKEIDEKPLWTWAHFPEQALSFDESVDAFADLFHKIIQEQVDGKSVAFPISGGLDSRSTVAALKNLKVGSEISSYSYGYGEDSIETKIASKVASAADLPFTSFKIEPYLFDNLNLVLDCVEGFQDLTQTRQAFISDYLAKTSNYVMAAHLGDLWLDDVDYPTDQQADIINFAHKKFRRKGSNKLLGLLNEDIFPRKNNDIFLSDFINRALTPLENIQDPDFRIKALKIETYVFRWSLASLRMYQPGAFPLLPFFDPRFYDFFCSLPTSYVAGRKLQIAYLKRYAPELAHVTWQAFDANLYHYQHFNSWLIPKRAYKKLGRALSGKKMISRNWEVQFLNNDGHTNLRQWLLEPGLKIHNFVRKEKLADFLKDFYTAPDAGNGYAVSMLLTFSAWLEVYG